MQNRQLSGKTALVTGSTSGIGLGIAHALAAEGANIVFNGFGDAAAIAELQQQTASQFGVKTAYSGADMTKPAEIEKMIADAIAQFGSIDILVNNAGIQYVANVEDFPADRWDAIIAINLTSAAQLSRLAVRHWREREFERHLTPASVRGGLALWAFFAQRPKLYGWAARLGIKALSLAARGKGRFSWLPGAGGWTQARDLPAPQGGTFQAMWKAKHGS